MNENDEPISILDLTDPKSISINVPLVGEIINLSKVSFLIDNSTEININFIRHNFLEERENNEFVEETKKDEFIKFIDFSKNYRHEFLVAPENLHKFEVDRKYLMNTDDDESEDLHKFMVDRKYFMNTDESGEDNE